MSTFSAGIEANIDNFQINIGKATQSIDKFSQNVGRQLDKVGDSFIKTGTSISKFVSVPLTGLIAGMGALALSTAQATKDLDSLSTITGISSSGPISISGASPQYGQTSDGEIRKSKNLLPHSLHS